MHNTGDLKEEKNDGRKSLLKVQRATCLSCFRNSPKQELEDAYEAVCPHCSKLMLPVAHIETDDEHVYKSICIKKCGGKDSLSKWEEIFHRPKSGMKGF